MHYSTARDGETHQDITWCYIVVIGRLLFQSISVFCNLSVLYPFFNQSCSLLRLVTSESLIYSLGHLRVSGRRKTLLVLSALLNTSY